MTKLKNMKIEQYDSTLTSKTYPYDDICKRCYEDVFCIDDAFFVEVKFTLTETLMYSKGTIDTPSACDAEYEYDVEIQSFTDEDDKKLDMAYYYKGKELEKELLCFYEKDLDNLLAD